VVKRSAPRCGLSSLEAVIALAISFPAAVFLFWLGARACRNLFEVIDTFVGWPYL
jgi:hypothetical protein